MTPHDPRADPVDPDRPERAWPRAGPDRQLTGPAAIELILSHVRGSVPDAIDWLKPNGAILERLAEAKLQEAGDKLARGLNRAIGR